MTYEFKSTRVKKTDPYEELLKKRYKPKEAERLIREYRIRLKGGAPRN